MSELFIEALKELKGKFYSEIDQLLRKIENSMITGADKISAQSELEKRKKAITEINYRLAKERIIEEFYGKSEE